MYDKCHFFASQLERTFTAIYRKLWKNFQGYDLTVEKSKKKKNILTKLNMTSKSTKAKRDPKYVIDFCRK